MDKKRVLYAILFIIVIGGIIGVVLFFNNATANRDKALNNIPFGNRTQTEEANTKTENVVDIPEDIEEDEEEHSQTEENTTTTQSEESQEEVKQEEAEIESTQTEEQKTEVSIVPGSNTTVKQLSDGTLYQVGDPLDKIDIVVGDKMYNTQITDINYNFSQYDGKTIEIEGMFFSNSPYTFVGRYSNVPSTCCPVGYAYFEYEWEGDQAPRLVDGITWLKVKGTLKAGTDSYGEYYYIAANSIEVMNERGIDTVNN